MRHHSQGLTLPTEHHLTSLPRRMTAKTLSGHPRTSRSRITASPLSLTPGARKCLHHHAPYQPVLHRRKTMPISSVLPSRLPSRPSWLFRNLKYPPSSTLLHPGLPNNLIRATTEIATEEIYRETYLPRQLQLGHVIVLITDRRRIPGNSVPSHQSHGHGWSRRP